MTFRFTPCKPSIWTGRYARVPGDTTAFHLLQYADSRPTVRWPAVLWKRGEDTWTCWMSDEGDASDLAEAVSRGKRWLGGGDGGSFQINEFGQVLVPSQAGDGSVALVGECEGPLLFEDPDGDVFDLTDANGHQARDEWERPYVGMPHNLTRYGQIYFWKRDRSGGMKLLPAAQDPILIGSLRAVRPYGAVKFLVGPSGLVLTKKQMHGLREEQWEPRYVGRINFAHWFAKGA